MFEKKRVAVAAGAIVVALTMAGCASGGSGSDPSQTAVSSGKASGTIKVWAQGAEAEKLGELAKSFEKENPQAKVEITAIPWGAAHQKYQTAIAGGSTPDLAQMGTTWMSDFAAGFEKVPAGLDTSGMFDGAKSAATVGGTAVGVPWYVDTRVVYYRKDLAAKAGYETPPTTWSGFQAMAKAMQTKAGATHGILLPTGAVQDDFQGLLPFAWSNGAELTNSSGSKWTFDSPAMVSTLQYINSFFTDGIASRDPNTATGGTEADFVSGKVPMFIGGPWETGSLMTAGGADFKDKIGVMMIPKQKSSTSFVGGADLTVFKNGANRDGAWKFVQYLIRPDVQVQFYKLIGDLPSQKAAWNEGDLKSDPLLQTFKAQLENAKTPPATTSWTQVSAAADQELEKMVRGGESPQQAAKALQSAADGVGLNK